jgi:surface antigen
MNPNRARGKARFAKLIGEDVLRKALLLTMIATALSAVSAPAWAIQCVAYARAASAVQLQGDAWQWWPAAEGLYGRGIAPRQGAVLVFARQGSMSHGHLAVAARVIHNRLILVDHANWAPTHGEGRGEVSTHVPVLDVSPANDWSQVRVWHQPADQFGNRVYTTQGFVYPLPPLPQSPRR